LGLAVTSSVWASDSLLNVSYDVSRELYKSINPAFETYIQSEQNRAVTVNQSHGGSSKQAMAVAAGLEADVITMNQSPDIQMLADKGLVAADWQTQFPHNATPYSTTTVFLVRKGNPENIQDWSDLTRSGLEVIVPNPKTSGNGRYTYLAAWGYALETTGTEQGAEDFVTKLFANVPVLDGGGRGATTTFTQRDVGDVLVTFENEAILIAGELGEDKFDVVYPSISIDASAPVAVIESVTEKRGTTELARDYLNFLYSKAGQEIIAKQNFRPRDPEVLAKYQDQYPEIKTFTVDDKLGGWDKVKAQHFADGALFDQIMVNR
jgi:sulfate transport system substrate-binding protein